MGKIKTQGTDLYAVNAATTAAKLACITAFSGLGGARGQIDVSCFSSTEMEFEGGMANPGQITVGGIYDTADTVFGDLVDLKDSGEVVDWYLGGSDGTSPPTVAASVLTAPTGRTGITFSGYVADITWQMDASSVWKYQLVIQRSGGWTLVPNA
mgnify:CR=1 FL=1